MAQAHAAGGEGGDGDRDEQEDEPVLVAQPEVLQDLDADDDAPIAQAGTPKKNRTYGYSAMNTRNTASSTGRSPKSPMSSKRADDARDDRQQQEHDGEPVRPSSPSISRPKYQKMAIVRTVQMPGSLASGHVKSRHTSPPRTASG